MYTLKDQVRPSSRAGGGDHLSEQGDSSQTLNMSKPRSMPRSALFEDKHLLKDFGSVNSVAPMHTSYELVSSEQKQRTRSRARPTSATDIQPKDGRDDELVGRQGKPVPHPHRKFTSYPLSVADCMKPTYGGLGSQFYGDPVQTETSPALAIDTPIADSGFAEVPAQPYVGGYPNLDKTHRSNGFQSFAQSCPRSQQLPTLTQLSTIMKTAVMLLDLDLTECDPEYDEEWREYDYGDIIPESLSIEIEKKMWQSFLLTSSGALIKYLDINSVSTLISGAACDSPERSTSTAEPSASNSSGQRKAGENWKEKHPGPAGKKSSGEHDKGFGGSGSGEPEGRKTITTLFSDNHELACPYNKLYPQRFCRGSEYDQKYQACSNSFKDTAALLQHFRERHYYNDRVCLRCHKQFGTKRTFNDHLDAEPICCRRPAQSIENELPLLPKSARRERLDRIGKRNSGVSNEQQWCRIWNALFPDHDCPDPYRRLDSLERVYDRAIDALIPGLVCDLLSLGPELDIEIAEAHCRKLTNGIRDRIRPFFEAGHSQSAELAEANSTIPTANVEKPLLPRCCADPSSVTSQGLEVWPQNQGDNLVAMYLGPNVLGEAWNSYDTAVDAAWTLSQSGQQPQGDFDTSVETPGYPIPHMPLWTASGSSSSNYNDSNPSNATFALRSLTQSKPGQGLNRS